MHVLYFIAGCLALIMTFGHSIAGEVFFFRGVSFPKSIFGDGDTSRRLVYGGWHFLGVPLGMTAIALFTLACTNYFKQPLTVATLIFWYYAPQAVIMLMYQIPKPIIFLRAPLWLGIIGIPVLVFIQTGGKVLQIPEL